MSGYCVSSAVAIIALLGAAPATDEKASVRQAALVNTDTQPEAIERLERDRQHAFVRGDADMLDRTTADAYTTVSPTGVAANKAQMMKNIRARKTQVLSVTLEDLSARVYGDVAILTGIYRDTHITDGQRASANSRFIRVFHRTNGGWVAVAYQQTALPPR